MSNKRELTQGFFAMLFPFAIVTLFIFGLGIGIGYLLRWAFKIEFGLALLTGIISTGLCLHFGLRLMWALNDTEVKLALLNEDEPEALDVDNPVVIYPPSTRDKKMRNRR